MLFDPKYTHKILTDIIFTDIKQNDFVVLYNTAINGKRQIRITEDAPLDEPIFRQGAHFKGKGVQSKQLSKREHELVGRKIYNHLTEDTKLFIM